MRIKKFLLQVTGCLACLPTSSERWRC